MATDRGARISLYVRPEGQLREVWLLQSQRDSLVGNRMASQRHLELATQAEKIRIDYLNAEIELGLMFARLSSRELDPASADQSRQQAVRASTIVHRFVNLIADSPAKHGLTRRLSELDEIIASWPKQDARSDLTG